MPGTPSTVRHLPVLIALTFAASVCRGGNVQTWKQDSTKDFQSAQRTRVVAAGDGTLRLSKSISAFADHDAGPIWSLCADAGGAVWLATGSPGAVVRIGNDGARATPFEQSNLHCFSVCADAEGRVYFGTAPDGVIRRIAPDGKIAEFCRTNSSYVWALAIDGSGNLWAAAGSPARVLRIDQNGVAAVVLEPPTPHVLSLAIARDQTVYAGTSDRGLIYRLSPARKPYVVLDALQGDIRTLALGDDGMLYAGTSTSGTRRSPGSSRSDSGSELAAVSNVGVAGSGVPVAADKLAVVEAPKSPGGPSPAVAPSPTPPISGTASAGENSVFRICPEGAVDEIFREKLVVFALAVRNGSLLIGAGNEGRLFELDLKTGVRSEWARLENGQITAMYSTPGGTLCAAANPGKVYRLDDRYCAAGELLSTVHDARLPSRWGKATIASELRPGTAVELHFRCGNVAKPDDTWSEWSGNPESLPAGRFLQYRIRMQSGAGDATPTVSSVQVHYATINRPPVIESIEIPSLEKSPAAGPIAKLKLKWKAGDPNGDALSHSLAVRKTGWPDWVTIARNLSGNEYEWDASGMPSGEYRLRLETSDRPSNSDGQCKSAMKTSDAFLIDRAAPTVEIASVAIVDRSLRAQVAARDGESRLAAAAYSIDGGNWIPLHPERGMFDGKSAELTVRSQTLEPGMHLVLVRVEDSAGNVGVADAAVAVDNGLKAN